LSAIIDAVDAMPETPETEGYFGVEEFAAMRSATRFINIGRGNGVNEAALLAALAQKRIAGAALDVFHEEPLSQAAGAHRFFMPPYNYSPDLNQLFSKLKHLLRKEQPRTVEATWRKLGHILDLVSPEEYANYLKNSGHASVENQHALAIRDRSS
jgi:lactate dehydrogenase-like 2-hydroxyacid dehydrogenase